jgi:SAM-dependent methyltransferase
LFLEVLEHLTDDSAALTEIRRVLRPNGRLILSVPVPPGEIDTKTPWGHKREGYQLAEIKSLLVKNGFQVQKFAFAEFQFSRRTAEVIRWWRKTTRLPAPIFFSWIAYLDFFLGSRKVETGTHLPATVLLLAQKSAQDRRGQSGPVAATAGSSCTESSESTRKPTSLRTAKFCFDTAARDLFHSDSVRSQIRNVFGSFRGL